MIDILYQVKSREQCVQSAKAILGYLKTNHAQSAILLKWWIVLFYGFAAASIDMLTIAT